MAIAEALSISDAARATGVSAHTLRYYERAGLMLDRVERASSSHRRYTDDEVRWVVLLTKLRSTGMPIRRMRRYAQLAFAGDDTVRDRLALLEAHRDAVRAELEELKQKGVELVDQTPRRGIAGMICFLHPKASKGVLVELATPTD